MTIGLLHHTGGGNLGDEGTQAAVIQNIRRRWPTASIVGLTMNPEDTQRRHGIPAYPIRRRTWSMGFRPESRTPLQTRAQRLFGAHRVAFAFVRAAYAAIVRLPSSIVQELAFLIRSIRIVRSLDLLVVNGGGQLTEWGGPWTFTYTVFKWVQMARLARVRCIFVNIGAGPLTRPLSKWFARRALTLATYASFRDERSRALARAIGFTRESQVFPDTVYSLDVESTRSNSGRRPGPGLVVGVAPMPYRDPRAFPDHNKDQATYDQYIATMAGFTTWLTERGCRVVLFGSDIGVDPLAIDDLETAVRRLGAPAAAIARVRTRSVEELLTHMAAMDCVVTCRFHGVVFAHLLNKPVIAVSHHPKVATLMTDIGLSKFCVDIDRCDVPSLTSRFVALAEDREEIARRMTDVRATYRQQLAVQFDELFPLEAA